MHRYRLDRVYKEGTKIVSVAALPGGAEVTAISTIEIEAEVRRDKPRYDLDEPSFTAHAHTISIPQATLSGIESRADVGAVGAAVARSLGAPPASLKVSDHAT